MDDDKLEYGYRPDGRALWTLRAYHRTQVEHTLAQMKVWKILRDYRRAAHTLTDTASGIAHLYNIVTTG